MILVLIILCAAGIFVLGATIFVMADYEQRSHGIERDCVHFRHGLCRLTHTDCQPCSLYKTEEERNNHQ